jgi:hypothetical protein
MNLIALRGNRGSVTGSDNDRRDAPAVVVAPTTPLARSAITSSTSKGLGRDRIGDRPDNSLFGPKKFPVIISREFGRKSLNLS